MTGPEKIAGAVLLLIGLAVFVVLAFAARKLMGLERAPDVGDAAVLCVFAAFGSLCALLGWRLLREQSAAIAAEAAPVPAAPSRRVSLSRACAAAGVALIVLAILLSSYWNTVAVLFAGLALLAVSHGLTPCVERLDLLRKARDAERQL